MNAIASARARFGRDSAALHHGVQLAAAVLIGYLCAMAVGLPERFWVVITTLIVMRPDASSTLAAGRERLYGTLVGVLCGLSGVYLTHLGANSLLVTLSFVSVLAFASAAAPMMRGAAVAALIILGAGDLPGYSAMHVALLRMAQIGIGIAVSLAIARVSSKYHAGARLQAGCAALLRRLAAQLQASGRRARPSDAQMDAASAALRNGLSALATLAGNADQKSRLFLPSTAALDKRPLDKRHYRRIVALTGRIAQDAAMLKRVLHIVRQNQAEPLALAASGAASAALASVAGVLAANGQPALGALRELAQSCCSAQANASAVMLAAPLRLLLDDLQQLCAGVEGGATAAEVAGFQTA